MGRERREGRPCIPQDQVLLATLDSRKRESFMSFTVPADPPGVPAGSPPIANH